MSDPYYQPKPPLAPPTRYRMAFARPGPRAWLRVEAAAMHAEVLVNGRPAGSHMGGWTPFEIEISGLLAEQNELEIRCEDRAHTTEGFLPIIGVRWSGVRGVSVHAQPAAARGPAVQRAVVHGTQLLVDGRPTRVRGVLHWGYYRSASDRLSADVAAFHVADGATLPPWPDEAQMRAEIEYVRSLGFNLIKFCLWIPPRRYYELCDELGMLVWQEYPVWNMPLAGDADWRAGILREFEQMFLHDRPHACVILRTLTCENDRIDRELSRTLIHMARELIPGCVIGDNSGWLCAEAIGDFHDEHPYLHPAQMRYYGRRMRPLLRKPLLLGETMCVNTWEPGGAAQLPPDEALTRASRRQAVIARRQQITTLARDLPEAGFVVTGLRDVPRAPIGLCTLEGRAKFSPQEWDWHGERMGLPRDVPEPEGEIIGPRKGQWKCPEYTWWSPVVRVLDERLPRELIERELMLELLSGRVLSHADGTRVLVEVLDLHDRQKPARPHPLVIEFRSGGRRQVVSALRHDTPAGRELWEALLALGGEPPEIGELAGTSIVLERWEMSLDQGRTWTPVRCDTPLVNHGRNVFEGWATFRTVVDYPGGAMTLRCEAVGDYFELRIDGHALAECGPREGTWDGTRDVPREIPVELPAGPHEIMFHVRDWRAAGGMVGPVFFARDLGERVF